MDHQDVYERIAEKLDGHAGGAPKAGGSFSPAFLAYLKLLYTPEQAGLVQYLKPLREFYSSGFDAWDYTSVGRLAELSGKTVQEVRDLLDPLVERNAIIGTASMMGGSPLEAARKTLKVLRVLYRNFGLAGLRRLMAGLFQTAAMDIRKYGLKGAGGIVNIPLYALPVYPSLLNAHQFHPEVKPDDVQAGHLYQEYFIKDGYYRRYQGSLAGTPTFRTVVVNRVIRPDQRILNSEEAHAIIDASNEAALVPCPCRTRTEKLGIRECRDKNPVAFCIMLDLSALHFEAAGYGTPLTKEEAKQYLDQMQDLGLVAATENFSENQHSVICLCCNCCCSMLRGRTRWDNPQAMLPSNFLPEPGEDCVFCGKCQTRCPVGAISVEKKRKRFSVDSTRCIGCGVCTITCKTKALRLKRYDRSRPPADARAMYDQIEAENRPIAGRPE